jgi:transposase-like protein
VVDGGKGLRAGVTAVFGPETPVQRCQWHRRENVVAYLPKSQQALWRGKLQAAYAEPTYTEAKRRLEEVWADLKRLNESAVRSLDEALEETLTLHRLGVGPTLRRSLATTNGLESIFSLVERRMGKVDRWRFHRRNSVGWRRRCWTLRRRSVAFTAIVRCGIYAVRFNERVRRSRKTRWRNEACGAVLRNFH